VWYTFFFQAEDGIRDKLVTGVQTCALPISVNWQHQNNFTMDMLYNGGASAQYLADNNTTTDPLLAAFHAAGANNFRWVNHTYTHEFLGCEQDFTVFPWRCQTDANGNIVWVPASDINSQILKNISWAGSNGIPINRGELVAGEHSGT